ncbi:MAG: class I SAM-dependent methyltransferase [Xanthobacteraceae bacterium]
MSDDARPDIYHDLHGRQLKAEELANRESANCILGILSEYLQPASVLDVGCGLGTWLSVLQQRGITDVRGVEGKWLKTADLVCDSKLVQLCDLEAGFDLERRFDLIVCLEVAEHLSPAAAGRFVESLVRHAPAVLFSAAIPFQGGSHHLNEQFLSYWESIFAKHSFKPVDVVRGRIWLNQRVLWWLRQNTVLFAHQTLIDTNDKLGDAVRDPVGPLSIVHPEIYWDRINMLTAQVRQLKKLEALIGVTGIYRTERNAQGDLAVTRIG